MPQEEEDRTAQNILARLSDLTNYPDEEIVPYREFNVGGKPYYFTPGGFLYCREPGTEEVGGFFCGYLSGETWHYKTDTVEPDEGPEDDVRGNTLSLVIRILVVIILLMVILLMVVLQFV